MKNPVWVVVGIVVALAGLLFTLQGLDVVKGSAMTDSTFWAIAGPMLIVAGLAFAGLGVRGRVR